MKSYECSVVPCGSYEPEDVSRAFDALIFPIDGLAWVTTGMKIVIKPNLVSAMRPEAAATTHPQLLKELCKRLIERGASVTVGDSPGGFFTASVLNHLYHSTGMTALEELGVTLNRNTNYHTADIGGVAMKKLTYTDYLDDCDAIIDFCKLKSHGMVGMSGAVKNLYGVIPGMMKPETHYIYPEVKDFANMLVDINEYFKPRLSIVDAVIGMEGNGPTAGTPRKIGALIASKTPYLADVVGAKLIGLDPLGVPTVAAAVERGLSPADCLGEEFYGDIDSLIVRDFKTTSGHSVRFLDKSRFKFVSDFVQKCFAHKPRPVNRLCVGCKKCANLCPAKAITMKNNRPKIDRKLCIRCFCCQEFCPKAAMVVHRPLVARALQGGRQ